MQEKGVLDEVGLGRYDFNSLCHVPMQLRHVNTISSVHCDLAELM